MHPQAETKLKQLLQRWATEEFKEDPELGIIPSLYYKLKSEGVEFSVETEKKQTAPVCTNPDVVTSQEEENDIIKAIEISLKDTGRYDTPTEYGSSSYGSEVASKTLPEPFKVRAIYDFDAAEDNELTIKSGEIIFVSDNSNANWWKGSNHRGEGLFPANFVSEDLDYKPEETISVVDSVPETVSDTTFSGEVKIDEVKIGTLIDWLNDTDPASESPDPKEMLKLEDEVHQMAPLIEENLQAVDKRIAMLNLVNEKIMASFDLFHSLSDNWSTLPPNAKYATMPISQSQVSMPATASTVFQNIQPFTNPQMMYVPTPSTGPQYVMAGDQAESKPVSALHTQVLSPLQTQIPTSGPQVLPTESSNPDKSGSNTNPVPTSVNQVCYPPMMMNSYHPGAVGSYFVPPSMQVPFPYPPNQPNMQPQGFIPPPGAPLNVMNVTHPLQSMGPYMPFPYYFMGSNPPVAQTSIPTSVSQASDQEKAKISSTTVAATESNVASSVPSFSTYSNDLQSMSFSTSSGSNDQNGLITNSTTLPTVNSNSHIEPVQVSK
ncbi:signal transducing adapter molecule 1, partial [Nephila pilipes]